MGDMPGAGFYMQCLLQAWPSASCSATICGTDQRSERVKSTAVPQRVTAPARAIKHLVKPQSLRVWVVQESKYRRQDLLSQWKEGGPLRQSSATENGEEERFRSKAFSLVWPNHYWAVKKPTS